MAWRRGERGYLSLIALLLVIVIIGILFAALYGGRRGGGTGAPGEPATVIGGTIERADSAVCRNNLAQARSAISLFQANNQVFPSSLADLELGTPMRCPVGEEPYDYDPSTGTVKCVHPGHEGY